MNTLMRQLQGLLGPRAAVLKSLGVPTFVMLVLASLNVRLYPRYRRAAVALCWSGSALFILYAAHDAIIIRDGLTLWK